MGKRLERNVVLWEDWTKGANLSDRLLPEGVSGKILNFDPTRAGLLEKVRAPVDAGIPTFKAAFADIEVIRFTYFYMNGVDYLVIFGRVGEHEDEPDEGMPLLIIWGGQLDGADPIGDVRFTEADGYFHEDVFDVRFVPSMVGGVSTLRVYPIYPDDVLIPKHWWIPLRIFWREETHYDLTLDVIEIECPPWTPPPDPHPDDPPGYTVHIYSKDDYPEKERRLECACYGDGIRPQPCTNGGTYWDDCAYVHFRFPFGTQLEKGDLICIKYSLYPTAVYVVSKVVEVDTSGKFAVLAQSLKRTPFTDEYPPTHIPYVGFWAYESSRVFKIDPEGSSYETLEEGIACIRGLPILAETRVSDYVSIGSEYLYTCQGRVPDEIWETQYDKYEPIEYGFALMTMDGQIGNMVKRKFNIPFSVAAKYGVDQEKGFVFVQIKQGIFDDPGDSGLSLEEQQMAGIISGLVVFRKNMADGEFKVLGVLDRFYDLSDSVEEDSLTFLDNNILWGSGVPHYYFQSVKYSHQGGYATAGLIDSGQALSETVFSLTQGLEEGDLGVELGCRAPAVYGRKMYLGNVIEIRRWDDEDDPKWHDDEVRISLFDKGEMFNAEDYLGMAVGEADRIVSIGTFGRQILIIKQQRVFILEMAGSDEILWRQVAVFEGGAADGDHVVMTPYGPVWLSRWDMWLWDGERKVNLSNSFHLAYQVFMEEEDTAARIGYDASNKKIYAGGPSTDEVFVISLGAENLPFFEVKFTGFKPLMFSKDTVGRLMFLGTGGIYYAEGLHDETSFAGDCTWRSGALDLGRLGAKGKLYALHLYFEYLASSNPLAPTWVFVGAYLDGAPKTQRLIRTLELVSAAGAEEIVLSCFPWMQSRIMELEVTLLNCKEFRLAKIVGTFMPMDVK